MPPLYAMGVEFTNATVAGAKMMEYIHTEGRAFSRKVFDEDAGICRKVQAGVDSATRLAVLAEGLEDRVRHFQTAQQTSAV